MNRLEVPFKSFEKIVDPLIHTAKTHAGHTFLRVRREDGWVLYSYRESVDHIKKIAHTLREHGFAPGDRAAVVGENCPEWVFSYFGILWAGGVVVPLDSRANAAEWAHLMRHAECRFLFCSSKCSEELTARDEAVPTLREVVIFSGKAFDRPPASERETDQEPGEPAPRSRTDTAAILYTSGTMGVSKGVVLTHGNLLANLEQVTMVLDINQRDRFLSILPIHHSFETTCGLLLPLMEGATITFTRSLKSKDLIEDLKATRPTVLLAVPLLLEKLLQGIMKNVNKAPRAKRSLFFGFKTLARACDPVLRGRASKKLFRGVRASLGLDQLRYLVSGGAALPRTVSLEYERLGFPILQGYGLTETAPVLSVNLPRTCRNESAGLPLPGIEVKIVNRTEEGIGEIVVKGPNVMKGYYRNEEATCGTLQEGWLFTGDLGKIDASGFLYVVGRKKSLIVTRGGKNICPEEIEEQLLGCPFIKEALVLARIHPRTRNEEIHAILCPDFEQIGEYHLLPGRTTKDEKALRELLKPHIDKVNGLLADYKRIRSFSIREDEFPKTTTQKIKRYLFEGGCE